MCMLANTNNNNEHLFKKHSVLGAINEMSRLTKPTCLILI